MKKILVLNSGGTFNKVYNPLTGNLDVVKNNNAIEAIIKTAFKGLKILKTDKFDLKSFINSVDVETSNQITTILMED